MGAGDGTVLRIMDNAVNVGKDRGAGGDGEQEEDD